MSVKVFFAIPILHLISDRPSVIQLPRYLKLTFCWVSSTVKRHPGICAFLVQTIEKVFWQLSVSPSFPLSIQMLKASVSSAYLRLLLFFCPVVAQHLFWSCLELSHHRGWKNQVTNTDAFLNVNSVAQLSMQSDGFFLVPMQIPNRSEIFLIDFEFFQHFHQLFMLDTVKRLPVDNKICVSLFLITLPLASSSTGSHFSSPFLVDSRTVL